MRVAPLSAPALPSCDRLLRRMRSAVSRYPARRLTWSYVACLAFIALLTIAAWAVVHNGHVEQRDDGRVVNVAGRQRMLSQKISKAAIAWSVALGGERGRYESELRHALRDFRAGHAALVNGDEAMGIPATTDPEALARLGSLRPSLDGLADAAERLLAGAPGSEIIPVILAEQQAFLPTQDKLVGRFATLAESKVSRLEGTHQALLWITLALLLIEGLLVFRPASRAMRQQLQCLREAGELMSHKARHDSLTGLPNRNALLEHLDECLGTGPGGPAEDLAVFFLDFDRFKAINDGLGHDAGDEFLREVAVRFQVLAAGLPVGRLRAFRLGGDEFVMTLSGLGSSLLVRPLADRALEAFARPHVLRGHPCVATASIGVAIADEQLVENEEGRITSTELLRNADLAMMQAKAAGKARFLVFDAEMYRFAKRQNELERGLRLAVEADALDLHYLPIFGLQSGEVVGVEALLRWEHEDLGPIANAELLCVAERAGLIQLVGDWVFEHVAGDVRRAGSTGQLSSPPPRIHLNVSHAEASHPGFLARVETLQRTAAPVAGRLCLEFAEASLERDAAAFAALASTLSEKDVQVCIDNLGGNHASLADLARLEIAHVKLDPAMLDVPEDREAEGMLIPRAIVEFARGIGVSVIAPFVENQRGEALAAKLGVDAVEGFCWGKPMSFADAIASEMPGRRASFEGPWKLPRCAA